MVLLNCQFITINDGRLMLVSELVNGYHDGSTGENTYLILIADIP